jgi:hypothetical protein
MRRALLALVAVGLLAAAVLGWSGTASAISLASTSTSLTITPASTELNGDLTFTATVTGATVPEGQIRFIAGSSILATVPLTPVPGSTTQATASVTLPNTFTAGSNTARAAFLSADTGAWGQSVSPPVQVVVAGTEIHNTATSLSVSPSPVVAGEPVTLTAHVTREDGVVPTGTVTFREGTSLVGTADLDAAGYATLTRSDFPAGTHNLTASYLGPTTDVAASSGSASLTVTAPVVPTAVDTTTTLVTVPGTIRAGDTVTLRAHVVQTGTQTAPPGGPIVTFRNVTDGVSTYVGEAPLDANGYAEITVAGWGEGTYQLTADYVGDITDNPSSGDVTLTVAPADSSIDTALSAAAATAVAGTPATLTATLTAAGTPVEGETVTLAAGGQTCTATTGADGVAHCDVTVATPGTYAITATYARTDTYNASTASSTLVVTTPATTLTVPSITVASGGSATLAATLSAGSTPLSGRLVTLTAGTQSCTATTTAAGLASCTITFSQVPGSYTLNASFAGDATYAASTGSGTLTATGKTTKLLVLPALGVYHHTAYLSALLTQNGLPLANQPVTLTVGSATCTDTTNFFGIAYCPVTVSSVPPTATVTGTFAGAVGYTGSTDTGTMLIAKQPTVLKVTSSLVQHSGTVVVTAKLTDDQGNAIAGAPVVLTLGSTSTTVTTGPDGTASATFTRSAGSYAVSARYAGSSVYLGDTSASGGRLTCYDDSRFLIWGGNRPDLDDAVQVGDHFTFWGSQWSKQVSRGDYGGGSSLKGWADSVSGSSWSTRTGNSVGAPGSVAEYISVLVTTRVRKSGSTLGGDVARVVVLRVDDPDRYDANPGHSAAGTVVAIL